MLKLILVLAFLAPHALFAKDKNNKVEAAEGWKRASKDMANAAVGQANQLDPEKFACDFTSQETEDGIVTHANTVPKIDINTPGSGVILGNIFGWLSYLEGGGKHEVYVMTAPNVPYQIKIIAQDALKIQSFQFIFKSTPDKSTYSAFRYSKSMAEYQKKVTGPLNHPVVQKIVVIRRFFGECTLR